MTVHGKTDSGKWVVLIAVGFNMLFHASINYNVGVINVAVLDHFKADVIEVSWLIAFHGSLFALAAPLASIVINFTNCRMCVALSGVLSLAGYVSSSLVHSITPLFFTLALTGIGHAFTMSGGILVLSYYFPNDLAFVQGVSLATSGIGSLIHPVLTQYLVDTFGFNGAMRMLGGIAFHSAAFGLVLRPTQLETKSKSSSNRTEKGSRWKTECSKVIPPSKIFAIPAFTIFVPAMFLYSFFYQSMIVSLPGYLKTYIGLTAQEGSIAAMAFGGGCVASRFFSGVAASEPSVGDVLIFFGLSGLCSTLSFCGSFILQFHHGAFIYSFLFGLYSGGLTSLGCSIVVTIVGMDMASHGYGLMMMTYGLGGIAGPPVIGWMIETKGPHMLFTCCGFTSMTCAVLGLIIKYLQQQRLLKDDGLSISTKDVTINVCVDDYDNVHSDLILIKDDSCTETVGRPPPEHPKVSSGSNQSDFQERLLLASEDI